MITRREFLKLAGATLVASALSSCLGDAAEPRDEKILVVGAGVAGLAAARALSQAGYEVLLIEGRDRLGGRLWTTEQWPDARLDLGASWIHGQNRNPLSRLAAEAGARLAETSYDRAIVYDTTGQPVSAAQERQIARLTAALWEAIEEAQDADEDQSVETAVRTALNWSTLTPEERKLAGFILNSGLEQEHGGSLAELSVHWFDEAEEFSGEDAIFVDGYKTIVDYLARDLPVEMGQTARAVEIDARGATVQTDGAAFRGDRVVVTLPLGVLKAGQVTFSPGLPARKQAAIAALGMGTLNKCYLRFPSLFWPPEFDWLTQIPAEHGRWVEWVSLARPLNQPILLGFNAADFGREIEAWSDQAIVADGMATLRRIFGRNIPDPVAHIITRWRSDPFSLGSYSFNAVGSTPAMRDALAQPVNGRLFFAGEATARDYFGTVHGAYLSGVRAAEEVMRQT